MFSRNQTLGGELDEANKKAAAAEADAQESKQELVRQVRSPSRDGLPGLCKLSFLAWHAMLESSLMCSLIHTSHSTSFTRAQGIPK